MIKERQTCLKQDGPEGTLQDLALDQLSRKDSKGMCILLEDLACKSPEGRVSDLGYFYCKALPIALC
jgi:hypothetical protein